MVGWVFIGPGGGVVLPDAWWHPVAGCMACGRGGVLFASVFRRPSGRLFSGGGVGGGGLMGRDMALKLRRLARGSKTALERECRVGVGVFSFWAFIER